MRQWLRSHLTYANVMVTILAFLVLGGGSAVALSGSNTVFSDDVVDNQVYSADVRDDTQTGGGLAAADLKAGSVGTSEVADNSVHTADITNNDIRSGDIRDDNFAGGGLQSSDIVDNSLSGVDVEESTLNGVARKLIYEDTAVAAPAPKTTIATLGAYTLKASCELNSGVFPEVTLYANGPGGTVNHSGTSTQDNLQPVDFQGGRSLTALTDEIVVQIAAQSPHFRRIAGTLFLQSGGLLVQVDYHAAADAQSAPGSCFLYGMATFGT